MDATQAAGVVVSFARRCLLSLPGWAACFCEWAALEVPVFCGVAVVILAQALAHTLACVLTNRMAVFDRAAVLFDTQQHGAPTRTSRAHIGITGFDIEGVATIATRFLDLILSASKRTEARLASCLVYAERLAASLTDAFNLTQAALPPAGAEQYICPGFLGETVKSCWQIGHVFVMPTLYHNCRGVSMVVKLNRDKVKRVVAAVDWGFTNPGVIQVYAVDGNDRLYLVHEVFQSKRLINWWVEAGKRNSRSLQGGDVCL